MGITHWKFPLLGVHQPCDNKLYDHEYEHIKYVFVMILLHSHEDGRGGGGLSQMDEARRPMNPPPHKVDEAISVGFFNRTHIFWLLITCTINVIWWMGKTC